MEKLLQHVWRHKLLPLKALLTTGGVPLEIVDPGLPNSDAGPDFFNAKLRIGGTMWAGNVEIHLRSSDWYRHGHDTDEVYNNVILHVAQVVDCEVKSQSGKEIPQLQLDIPASVHANYEELLRTSDYPRCHRLIRHIDPFVAHSWMDTLLSERQQTRSAALKVMLNDFGGDWERVLFVSLARSFGFGLNGDAFEAWAKLLPIAQLGKHRDDLMQVEAVFLGMANLIGRGEETDEYIERLREEWEYQRRLFSLPEPLERSRWRYLRLRPQNFPHIRIVQLAWMYHKGRIGLSALLDCVEGDKPVTRLLRLLDASTSDYWTTHVMPAREVRRRELSLSANSKRLVITNTVVPLLCTYADLHGDDSLKERLYDILNQLPAEDNRILRLWAECGLSVKTAADSQALIELKKNYCDRYDCLRCQFGHEYLLRINHE